MFKNLIFNQVKKHILNPVFITQILSHLVKILDRFVDTPEEREKFAKKLNSYLNIPILDEDAEEKLFTSALKSLHEFLGSILKKLGK